MTRSEPRPTLRYEDVKRYGGEYDAIIRHLELTREMLREEDAALAPNPPADERDVGDVTAPGS